MESNQTYNWPESSSEHTRQLLETFLSRGSEMPHAYLFLGQNNTSELIDSFTANITQSNIDIVRFDAANKEDGHTGIETIREVLQLASLMPVAGVNKVVIMANMQEANPQMLNALLKTLEEPPAHAIFVLSSTRPLIPTVMSRCQLINVAASGQEEELSEDLVEALNLLQTTRSAGLAEKLSLVSTLADMDDSLLTDLLTNWMNKQVQELKQAPQQYKQVQATIDTITSLRGNFNKKMVLQNFVTTGL